MPKKYNLEAIMKLCPCWPAQKIESVLRHQNKKGEVDILWAVNSRTKLVPYCDRLWLVEKMAGRGLSRKIWVAIFDVAEADRLVSYMNEGARKAISAWRRGRTTEEIAEITIENEKTSRWVETYDDDFTDDDLAAYVFAESIWSLERERHSIRTPDEIRNRVSKKLLAAIRKVVNKHYGVGK